MKKFCKSHLNFCVKVATHGANDQDKDMIHKLYKMYINPDQLTYTNANCNSCITDIKRMWKALKDYIDANGQLFIN